ncbi:3-dehydroquinate synthase [filamentous cyanobacterium CCP5]|nr:3-dehydroquinate synthase [filamentous cyanobacterium CCP5]
MNKTVVSISLPQLAYDVIIAAGGLSFLGQWLSAGEVPPLTAPRKLLVVSNPTVFQIYGPTLIESLTQAGFEVSTCLLPDGEQYKTLESVQTIYDAALQHRLERRSAMVALGGGVIGDMTGFAAATWLRGIPFVQVPTSLLAMVDASIGGKTGVNHPQGKNLIGAFHQPKLVLIDPQVLETLPVREFRAGMAEVIKYGIIWDQELFAALESAPQLDRYEALSESLLHKILTRSCQAKADVVSQDEKEAGLRAILNYGHTIGHAIESLTGYSRINHGEAVAMGMAAAGWIAEKMDLWKADHHHRQLALIQKTNLPTAIPGDLDDEVVLRLLQTDKKVKSGRVRFILPAAIGRATITDQVSSEIIRQVLQQLKASPAQVQG